MVGPQVRVNSGGAPGAGSGIAIKPPVLPGAADGDKAGNLLDDAPLNRLAPGKPKAKRMLNFSG
ncbi:hypothetical protein D3C78_1975270 [compost metagenome]